LLNFLLFRWNSRVRVEIKLEWRVRYISFKYELVILFVWNYIARGERRREWTKYEIVILLCLGGITELEERESENGESDTSALPEIVRQVSSGYLTHNFLCFIKLFFYVMCV
jgi:hypothetical protein